MLGCNGAQPVGSTIGPRYFLPLSVRGRPVLHIHPSRGCFGYQRDFSKVHRNSSITVQMSLSISRAISVSSKYRVSQQSRRMASNSMRRSRTRSREGEEGTAAMTVLMRSTPAIRSAQPVSVALLRYQLRLLRKLVRWVFIMVSPVSFCGSWCLTELPHSIGNTVTECKKKITLNEIKLLSLISRGKITAHGSLVSSSGSRLPSPAGG